MKNIRLILTIAAMTVPLIGCATSNVRIQPTAAISWYPITEVKPGYDAVGPGGDDDRREALSAVASSAQYEDIVSLNWASTFQMSLTLFDKYGADFGFYIDDPAMKKISNFLGSLNSDRFGVKFNYHTISGRSRWTGGTLGPSFDNATPPNFNWELTNMMVSLYFLWNIVEEYVDEAPMQMGIFWKRMEGIPSPLSVNDLGELQIGKSGGRQEADFYGVYLFWDFGEAGREIFGDSLFLFFHVEGALGFCPVAPKSGDGTLTIGNSGYLMGGASAGVGMDIPLGARSKMTCWLGIEGKIELSMLYDTWNFGPMLQVGITF